MQTADANLQSLCSLHSAIFNFLVIQYTPMIEVPVGLFTVGVFQDVAWAAKGLDALKRAGFPPESLTILAKETPEAAALIEKALGAAGERLEVAAIGAVVARGPLLEPLQGASGDLAEAGPRRHDAPRRVSGARRAESSRRSPAAAGCSSRSAASRAPPMRSRFCIPTAAAMRRSAPGSAESRSGCGYGRQLRRVQAAFGIRNPVRNPQ